MERVAIYSRKSKYTGKRDSVENQIEICRQYLKFHHPSVAMDSVYVFEDEGY